MEEEGRQFELEKEMRRRKPVYFYLYMRGDKCDPDW